MKLSILAVLIVLAAATTGFGQATNGQNNNGGRGNRQFGRQQFDQRLKEELGASDQEWSVLQPRIEKVREMERAASTRGSRFGQFGRRNRNPDAAANPSEQTPSPVQEKAQALRQLLADKNASPDAIKTAVAELRDARTKARADLKKAQDDLRDLLTARQEAVLIMAGVLE